MQRIHSGKPSSMGRAGLGLAGLLTVLLGAIGPQPSLAAKGPKNAEDLLIVDCLLPGQIRRLGSAASFMSARRPIRTTQSDCEIRGGEYVAYDRANYQTALQVWMTQALSGSAEAQNYVGEIYLKGLGTPPDFGMAAQWFQKAADQGFKRAKTNLAYLYEEGLGVQKDELKALNLYREASGASGDELLFASAVQVQLEAKDAEIGALQTEVEARRKEAESLRGKVRELESQLSSRKQALDSARSELSGLRQQLSEARKSTGADFAQVDRQKSELDQRAAELQRLMGELQAEREAAARRQAQLEEQTEALKRREAELASKGGSVEGDSVIATLKEQAQQLTAVISQAQTRASAMQGQVDSQKALLDGERKAYEDRIAQLEAAAAGRQQDDWELMKLLESQLVERETAIRQQQLQIAQLERQVSVEGGALLAAAPTLEIINPPLVATRSRPTALLQAAPGRQSVVGKVTEPQAIDKITVNGTPVIIGDNGLFRASVDVQADGSLIQVAALSKRGEIANLEFTLVPQVKSASAGSGSASASGGTGSVPSGVALGNYHALVIGNNSYQSGGFAPLQSAVNDATAVAKLLKERYGFKTTLLLNAGRFDVLSALNDLRETLKAEDNLLVYYAGHGDLSQDGKTGYWVPVDGQAGLPNTWISNTMISDILETMQSKHILVVADSCYSGALTGAALPVFAAEKAGEWPQWVKQMNDGRSRIALTSGGVQPVPDQGSGKHSYFARAFLNTLQDNNKLLEGQRLYREISTSLALATLDSPFAQAPQYAPIQFAGHESGEFFFLPKGAGRAP
ncbi:MAG: caspase family protein [Xanthomonadales bacterium]|nr:caspase family protein [Xanthomonadales bacterium]